MAGAGLEPDLSTLMRRRASRERIYPSIQREGVCPSLLLMSKEGYGRLHGKRSL